MKKKPSIYFSMGGLFMQIKTILRSLLLAYALSGICLLLLALMVFKLDIGQGIVTVGILVIYVVSCLAGGFLSGKLMRQNKYKWGFLVGLCYDCFICGAKAMGYECTACYYDVFYVSGRRHAGWYALVKKRLLFRAILCYTVSR